MKRLTIKLFTCILICFQSTIGIATASDQTEVELPFFSGSGGMSSAGLNLDLPLFLSEFAEGNTLNLVRPLNFSETKGEVKRDINIKNLKENHYLSLEKDTKLTYIDAIPYEGIIDIPKTLKGEDKLNAPEGFKMIRSIYLGDQEENPIIFSKPALIIIKLPTFKTKIDPNLLGIYLYNKWNKKFSFVNNGQLTKDNTYIFAKMNNMYNHYAVLYKTSTPEETHPSQDKNTNYYIEDVRTDTAEITVGKTAFYVGTLVDRNGDRVRKAGVEVKCQYSLMEGEWSTFEEGAMTDEEGTAICNVKSLAEATARFRLLLDERPSGNSIWIEWKN